MSTANKVARRRIPSTASKVERARAIFLKMGDDTPRRDVVNSFVKDIGLTSSGASTYYQKFLGELKKSGKTITSRPRGRPADESSKAGLARAMFKKMNGKPRKEIIQQFIDKLDLTEAGAATYYQTLKKAA
jgi:transcription initiation factor TFIIIB Brf1 subunit/transcription initiation factor TFIIB